MLILYRCHIKPGALKLFIHHKLQHGDINIMTMLFSLYMLPLGQIIEKHGVSFHCYADDTQLYLPVKPTEPGTLTSLIDCLNHLKHLDGKLFPTTELR